MIDTSLIIEHSDGLTTLTLNRPEKRNALNSELLRKLLDALQKINVSREVRAILLTGTGSGFCSGADLSDLEISNSRNQSLDLGLILEKLYNPIITEMRLSPKPIVCAVNGTAAGAGMSLALGSDVILAGQSASFVQAFSRLGLMPDMGGTWLLPRMIGTSRTMSMAMLAESISAEQAKDWGLIYDVVEDEKLSMKAREVALKLASGPTLAHGALKNAINRSARNSFIEQLQLEKNLQRQIGQTQDFSEGVSAFLSKRPPNFKGK